MDRWASTKAATLALVAVLALGGCGSAAGFGPSPGSSATPTATMAASPSTPPHAMVSLGIYSGRPDPSWDLSAAQTIEVLEAIAELPMVMGTPPEGGLGYHGFTLALDRQGPEDETVVAFRATVAPICVGSRPYRTDADRTIERLLLDSGRSTLAPTEVATVEADLAAAP